MTVPELDHNHFFYILSTTATFVELPVTKKRLLKTHKIRPLSSRSHTVTLHKDMQFQLHSLILP